MSGRSGSLSASPTRFNSLVTTPSGPHSVYQGAGQAASIYTPMRGSRERHRNRNIVGLTTRTGVFISPVSTAVVRQNRPLPARTFGMAPVVNVRRTPAVR